MLLECISRAQNVLRRFFNMEMPLPGCVLMDSCIAMNFRNYLLTVYQCIRILAIFFCLFVCFILFLHNLRLWTIKGAHTDKSYENSAFWKSLRFIIIYNETPTRNHQYSLFRMLCFFFVYNHLLYLFVKSIIIFITTICVFLPQKNK